MTSSRPAAIVVLLLAVLLSPTAAIAQGSLKGCVTDKSGGRIPGADVIASREGLQQRVVTDVNGCFAFLQLPAGTYTVTASLAGFETGKRDGVRVADGQMTDGVNFALCLGPLDDPLWVDPGTLEDVWKKADLVARLRIKTAGPLRGECPNLGFEYTAEVAEVFKAPAGQRAGTTVTFEHYRWREEPTAYAAGQEMVVFLDGGRQSPFSRAAGPFYFFVIAGDTVSARLQKAVWRGTTAELLAKLRGMKANHAPDAGAGRTGDGS